MYEMDHSKIAHQNKWVRCQPLWIVIKCFSILVIKMSHEISVNLICGSCSKLCDWVLKWYLTLLCLSLSLCNTLFPPWFVCEHAVFICYRKVTSCMVQFCSKCVRNVNPYHSWNDQKQYKHLSTSSPFAHNRTALSLVVGWVVVALILRFSGV